MAASEVLNLAQAPPIRARFGFSDDDLESITRWVRQANIRWGFDQEHRKPFGSTSSHTWRFGIDPGAGRRGAVRRLARVDRLDALDDVSSNRVELGASSPNTSTGLQRTVGLLNGARPLRRLADRTCRRYRPAHQSRRQRRLADQPDAARVRRRARDGRPA